MPVTHPKHPLRYRLAQLLLRSADKLSPGCFYERIEPGSFRRTLSEMEQRLSGVQALINKLTLPEQ